MSADEVLEICRAGAAAGCKEALFTLGDRPEDRWDVARTWLDEAGYDSTLDYVRSLAIRVLEETGLLPHLNPGVLTWEEIARLKPVAPSMGMMLETTSTRLFTEPGGAHFGSPDKDPAVRLRVLEDAGRHNVPFTTGILVGIGETRAERADSLFADPQGGAGVRPHPGSDHPELPGQARHGDAVHPGRRRSRSTWPRSRRPGSSSARRRGSRHRRTCRRPTNSRRCWLPGWTTGAASRR